MTNSEIKFPCCVKIEDLSLKEVEELERVFCENNANKYESVKEYYVNGYPYYGVDHHGDTMFYDDVNSYTTTYVSVYTYEEVMSFYKPEDNEWIEWSGGECPLPSGTFVRLKLKDGSVTLNQICEYWDWDEKGEYEIVGYKVIETPYENSSDDDVTTGSNNITVNHVQSVQISVKDYGVIELTMDEAKQLLDELCAIFTTE